MSSATTLSVDVEASRIELDKPISYQTEKTSPEEQAPPTKEFKFLPVPVYLRYRSGEPVHFGIPQICFLSAGIIFCT